MKFIDTLKQKLIPPQFRDTHELDETARKYTEKAAAAESIADPAERIFAALEAKRDMEDYASSFWRRLRYRSDSVEGIIYGTSAFGGVGLGAALLFLANPIAAGIAFFGGIVIGMGNMMAGASDGAMEKYFDRTFKEHLSQVTDQHAKVANIVTTTLEANTVAIAASPRFGEIYDKFPEVRDHFIKSFNQAAARGELPKAPAPPAAPDRKDSLKL